jgi:hypothetical protein
LHARRRRDGRGRTAHRQPPCGARAGPHKYPHHGPQIGPSPGRAGAWSETDRHGPGVERQSDPELRRPGREPHTIPGR